ncbi:SPOR domain-containing protein [Marimonas lutisalis]|uniref:SPOR domain-containing protein n=1 Tax=Marimonas lutisalis TaxID=2545756 RepID=UPI0010F4B6A0|nr:SPOR domain-containing protein [Marimonas lutisalis]
MKIQRYIVIGAAVATMALSTANAQSLRDADIPAEFPPASFKGKQYVDSRGCVYIRAGIDGLTNWVPRVSRDRSVLCGYQPTFAKTEAPKPDENRLDKAEKITAPAETETAQAQPETEPAPTVRPMAKPAEAAAATPAPKPEAKPAPRRATAPKPAPARATRKTAAAPRATAPAAVAAAPAPAPAAVPQKTRRITRKVAVTDCTNVTGISRYYAGVGRESGVVRCGSQTAPIGNVIRREDVIVMRNGKPVTVKKRVVRRQPVAVTVPAPQPAATRGTTRRVKASDLPPNTRIVPLHVYKQQQAARLNGEGLKIPKGYRAAWDDDRLNPKRAHQTIDGVLKSGLAWTNTVPRRLYERETGRVVTHLYPGLKYPYHTYAEMQDAGYSISTKGPLRETRTIGSLFRKSKPAAARVSTKTTPRKPAATAQAGRYVQVGTFGDAANAQRSAARLQKLGLPVRMGKYTKGGREYRIVMAGPFSGDQIGGALGKARSAGFRDAFVRK